MTDQRIICWFSCGVASAVATKLAIEENAKKPEPLPLIVARCWVAEEDADNDRFSAECRKWFGVPILPLVNIDYEGSIYGVFKKRRFISGPKGAPCTMELKKAIRERFQRPGDIHVFGYTVDEAHRWDQILDANNGIQTWNVLGERSLKHADCLAIVERAGIRLPDQYARGFEHNNCLACVKATSPDYWKMVRFHHPAAFSRMAEACKPGVLTTNGARLARVKGERIFLHELPEGDFDASNQGTVQCGIFCELAEKEMAESLSGDSHEE
jgi:hypothetical protein